MGSGLKLILLSLDVPEVSAEGIRYGKRIETLHTVYLDTPSSVPKASAMGSGLKREPFRGKTFEEAHFVPKASAMGSGLKRTTHIECPLRRRAEGIRYGKRIETRRDPRHEATR